MKTVIFIRHAKSSWEDISLRDIDRPLNPRGQRDAPFMAKVLRARGFFPDAILSSPANRAFTTATYFAEAFELSKNDIIKNIDIYDAYPEAITDIVTNLENEWNIVLIFGHNPTCTSLANKYHDDYIPNVPTCGIIQVEADIEKWKDFSIKTAKRVGFFYPKQYFVAK